MKLKNNISLFLSGFPYIVLLVGCSAGKNTTGTRAYHELTTRYNIYFNAEEDYHSILKERAERYPEDYAEPLPFYFPLSDAEKSLPGGPFDPVIDKTEKAILAHSITAKPRRDPDRANSQEYRQWLRQEEFNPFLKNVWLLRGKAFLQNGAYNEALSVFTEMLRLFAGDTDLVNETEIWMLRTYTEAGRFYDAEKTVYALRNKKLPPRLEKLFNEHYTYLLILKKEFAEAIPRLRKSISHEPDQSRKKRLQFLLGQLYALTGEKNEAFRAFEEVKGITAPFEITLNATLWQTALSSGEQQRAFLKRLKKMEQKVNDADSLAFFDQRYRIFLNVGNDSLALAFKPPEPEFSPLSASLPETDSTTVSAGSTGVAATVDTTETGGTASLLFSEGRTLSEIAALHRQWRLRNGLRQPLSGQDESQSAGDEDQIIPFDPDKSGLHYLLLTYTPGSADKNRLLFITANFNFTHFKLSSFTLSHISLPGIEALRIEPFRSWEEVSRYRELMISDSLFRSAIPIGVTPVVISEENLKLVWSGQRMNEYNTFCAEQIAPLLTSFGPERGNETAEIEEKSGRKTEKNVPLETLTVTTSEREVIPAQPEQVREGGQLATGETPAGAQPIQPAARETTEALKQRLEENAAKALRLQQETAPAKSRKQLLKEQERQRKEKIKQRERELKEKQRIREAALKQREKERQQKIRKSQ